jgi:hypothetical protein
MDYRLLLKGAIVQVFFTLTRFVFPRKDGRAPLDVYAAEIVWMRRIKSRRWFSFDDTPIPRPIQDPYVSEDDQHHGKNKKARLANA